MSRPGAALDRRESLAQRRRVVLYRQDKEQSVGPLGELHRGQWLETEVLSCILESPLGLGRNGSAPVGVVVSDDALAPLEEACEFIQVGVLLCSVPVAQHRMGAASHTIVGIDEHEVGVLDSGQSVGDPRLSASPSRLSVARNKVAEGQGSVVRDGVRGEGARRLEGGHRPRSA